MMEAAAEPTEQAVAKVEPPPSSDDNTKVEAAAEPTEQAVAKVEE